MTMVDLVGSVFLLRLVDLVLSPIDRSKRDWSIIEEHMLVDFVLSPIEEPMCTLGVL